MPIHLEIVTAERVVMSDDVDMINAPTKDGRVGILPRHSPLMTILDVGELTIVKNGERTPFALSGGFMEVLPNRVTILADTVERADEIDEERAERARVRAEERKRSSQSEQDMIKAEAELRRAMVRLRVAQLKRRRGE
ncbi:MAG: F0F1 ATP synthase subunit epsilon [Chloroflexaceae bacterium]|jgi:F-type H+-transporting ATPase subunit epsilon|nr:F0F1 ATP synthase subunit epsilon [Chloroflexaceae bacterium]